MIKLFIAGVALFAGFLTNEEMHSISSKQLTLNDFRVVRGFDDKIPGTERVIVSRAQAYTYAHEWKARAGDHFTAQVCMADDMGRGGFNPTADRLCRTVS